MDNAPVAETRPPEQGSVQQGVAGQYALAVGDVIREAWGRVSGNKGTVWIGVLIYIGVSFAIGLALGLLLVGDVPPAAPDAAMQMPTPGESLADLLTTLLTLPLTVGLVLLGAGIASGRTPAPTSLFSWYDRLLKLVLTYLLMSILIVIGLVLLVLPGIYLAVSYQLALPLVADKGLGVWEALETSRKTVTHKWFTFFGLNLVGALAVAGSMLLIGIPLIWVLPACLIGLGIMYRNALGVENSTLQRMSGG